MHYLLLLCYLSDTLSGKNYYPPSCHWSLVLTNYTDFSHFGPKVKVHRSIEVPGCIEININAIRDVQSTSKRDENHLRHKTWTLSRQF